MIVLNDGKTINEKLGSNVTVISVENFNKTRTESGYDAIIMENDVTSIDGMRIRESINNGAIFCLLDVDKTNCTNLVKNMYSTINEHYATSVVTDDYPIIASSLFLENGEFIPALIGEANLDKSNIDDTNSNISTLVSFFEKTVEINNCGINDKNEQRVCLFDIFKNASEIAGTLSCTLRIQDIKNELDDNKAVSDIISNICFQTNNDYRLNSYNACLNCNIQNMVCIGQLYINSDDHQNITNDFSSQKQKNWNCVASSNTDKRVYQIQPVLRVENNNAVDYRSGIFVSLSNIEFSNSRIGNKFLIDNDFTIGVYWRS